jgi:hypothetical protein
VIGQTVALPVCSGELLAAQPSPGQYTLVCSAQWQTKAGVLIDPGYLPELGIILDSGGLDWAIVYEAMGFCLGFWAIGAVYGVIYNLLRRGKPR